MTVHREKFLVNKTNRLTEFKMFWYYDSTYFGKTFRPSLGVIGLHRHWYILCSFDESLLPEAKGSGSKRSSKLHKMYQCRCTAKKS